MTSTVALYLTVCGHQAVFALLWVLAAWRGVARRVTPIWALATVLATAGLYAVTLRGAVPAWLGLVGAKSLLLAAMLVLRHGVLRFARRPAPWRGPLAGWAAATAAMLALNALALPSALTVCGAVAQALALLDIGRLILRHLRAEFGTLMVRVVAAPFFLMALLYAQRGLQQALAGPQHLDLPTMATAIAQSIMALVLNLALVTMIGVRLMAQLRHRSDHDGLTGLLNRRSAEERLVSELERARRHGTSLGLLSIDVDHFKQINDTRGHPAGDEVLVHLAGVLRAAVRQGDIVARVGGEEFWVLAPNADLPGTQQLADRVLSAVRAQPCVLDGQALPLSVSIGATVAGGCGGDGRPLLQQLDAALYAAKRAGRDQVAWAPQPD